MHTFGEYLKVGNDAVAHNMPKLRVRAWYRYDRVMLHIPIPADANQTHLELQQHGFQLPLQVFLRGPSSCLDGDDECQYAIQKTLLALDIVNRHAGETRTQQGADASHAELRKMLQARLDALGDDPRDNDNNPRIKNAITYREGLKSVLKAWQREIDNGNIFKWNKS